ncbi:MAG TPA: ferritin family protein [Rhodocyclaceae bacterium]|nr:ferritin family protein [Rhodocyclaceae bacterium]
MSYSLPVFLAHAIAMEREAAERYLELADMMEAHNNLDVASLFRDMVRYSTMHGDSIVERAGKLELPKLQSWQYRWVAPTEVGDEEWINEPGPCCRDRPGDFRRQGRAGEYHLAASRAGPSRRQGTRGR